MFQAKFKIPTYYPEFACKGGECRHCCCQGWRVTLTQEEYFRLHSLDCSGPLKEKIDSYVGILPHPSTEQYGRINMNYLGECPLRREDGYCGLQVECGEEKIPSVCRYYPRAPRLYPQPYCSISNSCEAVLELLARKDYVFSFTEKELSFHFDDDENTRFHKDGEEKARLCFSILCADSLPLPERLKRLCLTFDGKLHDPKNDLFIVEKMKETFLRSVSVGDYLAKMPENLPSFETVYVRLSQALAFDHAVTNILLNHLLYMHFPYVGNEKDIKEIGTFVYFLCYLWFLLLDSSAIDFTSFIDVTGDYFRLSEHSNFYQVLAFYLSKIGEKEE